MSALSLKQFKKLHRPTGALPRVISNSGGATSGLMTLREMEKGLGPEDYVIFCNTGMENPETLEFLHRQKTVLGVPLIMLEYCRYHRWKEVTFETASRNGEPFQEMLFDRRPWHWRPTLTETRVYLNGERIFPGSQDYAIWQAMQQAEETEWEISYVSRNDVPVVFTTEEVEYDNPNPFGLYLPNQQTRFCTQELKIRVMRDYMRSQGHGHWTNIVGIRADEPNRHHSGKVNTDARFEVEHPLYHAGIRKADVAAFWQTQPFQLELEDHEGNCTLCFLKGKGKLIKLIRDKPQKLDWWHEAEQAAGVTFSKRQSYEDLAKFAQRHNQQQTLDFWPDEESISCNGCTD